MKFQIPKGLYDILPFGQTDLYKQSHTWHHIENIIYKLATDYHCKEIRTPIFEHSALFERGVGPTSDIVKKEMYQFEDKAGRPLSLRPEGTSSVLRSCIENNLFSFSKVLKLFYLGPMFRYERPQAGRYRQHHQFGVEMLGISSPEQDAELIDLLCQLYKRLKIQDFQFEINCVGDVTSRGAFKEALLDFLKPHYADLSSDSQTRFSKNPLRILDSKEEKDKEIVSNAPSILDFLSKQALMHFEKLQFYLTSMNIPFRVNSSIVRGLDYYAMTVFEVVAGKSKQFAIGGGGRYDGFISTLGGPNIPGIGFGAGIERILQVLQEQGISFSQTDNPFVYFVPLGEEAKERFTLLAAKLRHKKIPVDVAVGEKKIHSALSAASSSKATYAIIAGSHELEENCVQWKNLHKKTEEKRKLDLLEKEVEELWHDQL